VKLISECFDIFLNEGDWTNQTIKELKLNGKKFHLNLSLRQRNRENFNKCDKIENPRDKIVNFDI
jgi:hypothetical protein